MKYTVWTNNPKVAEQQRESHDVHFADLPLLDFLKVVRDEIHAGKRLLSHPLSGSVKPGETPYKSVLLSTEAGALDTESLAMIESAVEACGKFEDPSALYTDKVLQDFQTVDSFLIKSAISSADM